jgi:phosphatidylglycerol:prolipoprotein diacylglycerol transferase
MSFHGGLIGIIISTSIYAKVNKTNFFNLTDIISCVAPIGIFLGRVSNFLNGELYGKPSSLPWSVVFPDTDNISRHPSQIYEAILEGAVLFVLINFFAFKKKFFFKTGYISSFFLIFYSILRIISEYFREPDQHLGYFFKYFSEGTLLSIITLLAGCFLILFIKKNEKYN